MVQIECSLWKDSETKVKSFAFEDIESLTIITYLDGSPSIASLSLKKASKLYGANIMDIQLVRPDFMFSCPYIIQNHTQSGPELTFLGTDMFAYHARNTQITENATITDLRSFFTHLVEPILSAWYSDAEITNGSRPGLVISGGLSNIKPDIKYPLIGSSIWLTLEQFCYAYNLSIASALFNGLPCIAENIESANGEAFKERNKDSLHFEGMGMPDHVPFFTYTSKEEMWPVGRVISFGENDLFKVMRAEYIFGQRDEYSAVYKYLLAALPMKFSPLYYTDMISKAPSPMIEYPHFFKIGDVAEDAVVTLEDKSPYYGYSMVSLQTEKANSPSIDNLSMRKHIFPHDKYGEMVLEGDPISLKNSTRSSPWIGDSGSEGGAKPFGVFYPETPGRHVIFSGDPQFPWKDIVGPMIVRKGGKVPTKNPQDYLLRFPDGTVEYYFFDQTTPKLLFKTKGEIILDASGEAVYTSVPSMGSTSYVRVKPDGIFIKAGSISWDGQTIKMGGDAATQTIATDLHSHVCVITGAPCPPPTMGCTTTVKVKMS